MIVTSPPSSSTHTSSQAALVLHSHVIATTTHFTASTHIAATRAERAMRSKREVRV